MPYLSTHPPRYLSSIIKQTRISSHHKHDKFSRDGFKMWCYNTNTTTILTLVHPSPINQANPYLLSLPRILHSPILKPRMSDSMPCNKATRNTIHRTR